MIEPMTLPRPEGTRNERKQKSSMTLAPSDMETVRRFQSRWKLESFSQALRRIIRDYAELADADERRIA